MILVVWPEFPPAIGGMETHGFEFVKYLQSKAVRFLCVTNEAVERESRQENMEFDLDTKIFPLRILSRANFSYSIETLRNIAREFRPSVVYSSHVALAPAFRGLSPVACRTAGNDLLRPWIGPGKTTFHTMTNLNETERISRRQKNIDWVISAASDCDLLIANTQWTANQVENYPFRQVQVLTGGVDTNRFVPSSKSSARLQLGLDCKKVLILIAARLVKKKGIDVALHALSQLSELNVELIIAGSGAESDYLHSLAEQLEILDKLRFLGSIPHRQIHQFFASADFLVVPSISYYDPIRVGMDFESMGRVICEASSCGLPVIASKTGGTGEVVEEGVTGILVEPGNPSELAQKIKYMAENDQVREMMGANARRKALADFSYEELNKKTMTLLDNIGHHDGAAIY